MSQTWKNAVTVLLALGLSQAALAEDYYAPVKKELEPLARIPMPEYTLNDETLNYTLPRDLTGREIKVQLQRDLSIAGDSPRIYRGDKATVACMGPNSLPACVVTHKNLGIVRSDVENHLRAKYRDPKKLVDALAVSQTFAGNEPIGIMSKRSDLKIPPMPTNWGVEIFVNSNPTSPLTKVIDVDLDTSRLFFVTGPVQWEVSYLNVDGNHIAGEYIRDGMRHWFDVSVNTERTSFEGTWGFFKGSEPLPASGTFKGRSK